MVVVCSHGSNRAGEPDLELGFAVHSCSCFAGSFDCSVRSYCNHLRSHLLCSCHQNSH